MLNLCVLGVGGCGVGPSSCSAVVPSPTSGDTDIEDRPKGDGPAEPVFGVET